MTIPKNRKPLTGPEVALGLILIAALVGGIISVLHDAWSLFQ